MTMRITGPLVDRYGSFLIGTEILIERSDRDLDGIDTLAQIVIALSLLQPLLLFFVERLVGKMPAAAPTPAPAPEH